MTTWKTPGVVCGLAWLAALAAAEPEAPKGEPLVVIDGAGKEHKLKAWKITAGTRPLGWLAAPQPEPADKKEPAKGKDRPRPATGPEALAFREENSTNFVDGILTLIPLDRIRSIDYDPDTDGVSVTVATGDTKDGDVVLKGTTKYRGINKLTIEAEVDKGDLGVAEIKFQGGVPKGSIRAVRFPAPKVTAEPAAKQTASILTNDKKDRGPFRAGDVQALYRLADGSERLLPTLYFKKTLKVDLSKLEKVAAVEGTKGDATEWVVKFRDGEEHTLSLLHHIPDEKQAQLEGLVGRVPGGYRLFPINLISEITFEEAKKE